MARGSPEPKQAVVSAQRYYLAADTGWNATAWGGGPLSSSVLSLESYALWSIYLTVTAAGNNELTLVVLQENGTIDLCRIILSAAIVGSANVQHLIFGTTGTLAAVVARFARFEIRNLTPVAGVVTMQVWGRAVP